MRSSPNLQGGRLHKVIRRRGLSRCRLAVGVDNEIPSPASQPRRAALTAGAFAASGACFATWDVAGDEELFRFRYV